MAEKRLANQAAVLAEWLSSPAGAAEDLGRIASTLSLRRADHDYRLAFVVSSHAEAIEALTAFSTGNEGAFTAQGRALATEARKVVWIFSGHGAQWAGMGKELLQDKVFQQAIIPLDKLGREEAGFSVIDALKVSLFMIFVFAANIQSHPVFLLRLRTSEAPI